MVLFGCENAISLEEPQFAAETWELIETKFASNEWQTVKPEEKHFLTFINATKIKYTDFQQSCVGDYFYDYPEYTISAGRLTLHVPCMVSASQLWWEHMIETRTDKIAITKPSLNPTAMMSAWTYKYKVRL